MRPIEVLVTAAGNSPWIPVDSQQSPFYIGLGVMPTSLASLTYSVQHTFDTFDGTHPVTIARSGTVATVTDTAHEASVGDSVFIRNSGDANLDGTYDIASIVDANTFTYTVANTGATAGLPMTEGDVARVFNHSTLVAQTTRMDGNYQFPVAMVRLKVTTYASGQVSMVVMQGTGTG